MTVVLVAFAAAEVWLVTDPLRHGVTTAVGIDLNEYLVHTRDWLATGHWYLPRQLAGRYVVEPIDGNVYPPTLLYLTLPLVFGVPTVLWYVVPLAVVAFTYWRRRPAWWAWPILGLVLVYPRTYNMILLGNPGLWAIAFAVAGTAWGWAAWGASLKLTFAPLVFVGVRSRREWLIGAVVGLALALPFAPLWLQYAVAIGNTTSSRGLEYVLGEWPIAIGLVVAALSHRLRHP